ncbi:MAG: phosphoglucosamine mutase [Bacteroidota bacterium]
MSLIKSISGIRGTIGGKPGNNLTPIDIVKFTASFISFIKQQTGKKHLKITIGRDARISGDMVNRLVCGTAMSMGCDVCDIGLSTTPTVEMEVVGSQSDCGIIITASHNPTQWNALKLLNNKGEFINAEEGAQVLALAENESYLYSEVMKLGSYLQVENAIDRHIDQVLALELVDVKAIKTANFKVAIDCVNSTGGIALPKLLKALGVSQVTELYCDPNGHFPHNPEPLPENLTEISNLIKKSDINVGFVVDPDVDRLAIVCENGEMFGEEYTLVAIADYILKHTPGSTVSNLSSTRALRDVTEKQGQSYSASAVGEVNVVELMKSTQAVIGGEGNGGVIYPELHYGRDSLVGIALFLTHLAKSGKTCLSLRSTYPDYFISKNKIELAPDMDVDAILISIQDRYKKQPINTIDGVKIEFDKQWIHLRKSNTEPIIRIYCESNSMTTAEHLANKIISDIKEIVSQ